MIHLKRNLPPWERASRLVLALVLAGLTWRYASGAMGWAGWAAAAAMATTAVVGFCPACAMVGRRSVAD